MLGSSQWELSYLRDKHENFVHNNPHQTDDLCQDEILFILVAFLKNVFHIYLLHVWRISSQSVLKHYSITAIVWNTFLSYSIWIYNIWI